MTYPGQPQWQQPIPPKPVLRRKLVGIIALVVAGCLVLCCAGVGVVGVIFGDDLDTATESTAVEQTQAPRLAAPITTTPTTTGPKPSDTSSATAPPSSSAKPTRTATRKATPKPKPKPKRTTKKPKPRPTTEEPDDVYYANCAAVRAAGADPIHRGDPGYSSKLDRDGDGVGCE